MRETPDIDQLKRQARELLEAYRAQSPDAVIEVAAHHRTATPETFALHDAQFVLARSYGFESWPKLKAAVDGVTTTRLHESVQKGDLGAARALLTRRPEIVDLMRGGPSGFEIRALHIAVMKRDVEMTRLLLEAGADTRGGIWPNRDATSPRTIAEERGYDEIVAMMVAQEEKRGARGANAFGDGLRRLRHAMMTGGEEAVIAVFESQPALADVCLQMTRIGESASRGAPASPQEPGDSPLRYLDAQLAQFPVDSRGSPERFWRSTGVSRGHPGPPHTRTALIASSRPPAIHFVQHRGPHADHHAPCPRPVAHVLCGRSGALDLGAHRARCARGPRAEPGRFVS
jgi:hypothetical protein